jgi:hypothetical protein
MPEYRCPIDLGETVFQLSMLVPSLHHYSVLTLPNLVVDTMRFNRYLEIKVSTVTASIPTAALPAKRKPRTG